MKKGSAAMAHNGTLRTAAFVLFTFAVIMSVMFLDSMPNHRFGDGDFDTWLALTLFPIIFLLHGVLSGIILKPSRKRLYFIITPLMLILAFFVCRLAFDGVNVYESIKIGLISGVCYTIVSVIGRLICLAVTKLILIKHSKAADS